MVPMTQAEEMRANERKSLDETLLQCWRDVSRGDLSDTVKELLSTPIPLLQKLPVQADNVDREQIG